MSGHFGSICTPAFFFLSFWQLRVLPSGVVTISFTLNNVIQIRFFDQHYFCKLDTEGNTSLRNLLPTAAQD